MEEKKDIEQSIANYLSGCATYEDKERLISWINESPENKRYFQQSKNIWQVAHPAFTPDEIDLPEAYSRIMERVGSARSYWRTFSRYWQYTAAVLVLPLVLFSSYAYMKYMHDVSASVVYQEVFSSFGSLSKIELPDGSIAWLNAGSSLKYPTTFEPHKRNVFLKGEAFFEVESDPENPFTVEVNGVDVMAVGTQFNVEAYPGDSLMAVTMAKGKVNVKLDSGNTLSLTPGERMGYNLKTNVSRVTATDPYKWCAWKDGLLVFRDDPLEYVLKKLNQTFNADIQLRDKELASHPYRATFHKESLDEILRLLRLTAPIEYRETTPDTHSGMSVPEKRKIEVFSTRNN